MSHFASIGDTDDWKYGESDCLDLAKKNSNKAIYNADNFEYWIEG